MNEQLGQGGIFSKEQVEHDSELKLRLEKILGVENVQMIGGGDLVIEFNENESIMLKKSGDKWAVLGEELLIDDGMIEEYVIRRINK